MPPFAIAEADPSFVPFTVTSVALQLAVKAAGSFTVDINSKVAPLLSVTVTVYEPAARLLRFLFVLPLFHK